VGCKEGLVRAYLEARHDTRRELITAEINRHDDPRERLLAIFDVLGTTVARPGFRVCERGRRVRTRKRCNRSHA
jgi:AcrR family transcriptional regulator